MSIYITILFLLVLFAARKMFSRYYLTPSGLLLGTWIVVLILKSIFAADFYFSAEAAAYISFFLFCFVLGEFLVSYATKDVVYFTSIDRLQRTLARDDFKKKLSFVIFLTGLASIVGAIIYLKSFINHFGSLTNVLGAGWLLREAVLEGDVAVPLPVRMILLINYSCIIFTLIYYLLYGFKVWLLLPYLSVLVMGVTQAGRAGTIMVLFQIFIVGFWKTNFNNITKRGIATRIFNPDFSVLRKSVWLVAIVLALFVLGELYKSQSSIGDVGEAQVSTFKVYLFGGIAGFSYYLDHPEFPGFGLGKFSFSSIFDLLGLSKQEFGVYRTFVPLTDKTDDIGNIFTSFRPLMEDFGIAGAAAFMLLLGSIAFLIYQKSIQGSLAATAMCIVMYTYLFHTFLLPITVHTSIVLSFFFPAGVLLFMQKIRFTR